MGIGALNFIRRDKSQFPMKSAVDVRTFSSHWVASPGVFERDIFRYGLAVLSVAIALGVKLILVTFNFPYPLSTSFLVAIAITFWYGEQGPAFFLFSSRLSHSLSSFCPIRLTIE